MKFGTCPNHLVKSSLNIPRNYEQEGEKGTRPGSTFFGATERDLSGLRLELSV